MAKRRIDGIEVEASSGNVFADLGVPDADKLRIKSGLAIEITRAIRSLGLTQEEAAHRMGIPQPKVSGLLRGDFANLSERTFDHYVIDRFESHAGAKRLYLRPKVPFGA